MFFKIVASWCCISKPAQQLFFFSTSKSPKTRIFVKTRREEFSSESRCLPLLRAASEAKCNLVRWVVGGKRWRISTRSSPPMSSMKQVGLRCWSFSRKAAATPLLASCLGLAGPKSQNEDEEEEDEDEDEDDSMISFWCFSWEVGVFFWNCTGAAYSWKCFASPFWDEDEDEDQDEDEEEDGDDGRFLSLDFCQDSWTGITSLKKGSGSKPFKYSEHPTLSL